MRNALPMMLLAALLAFPPEQASAAGRRRAAPPLPLLDAILITFVPIDGAPQTETALLDVGALRHDGTRERVTRITRTIGIRLSRPSGAPGSARLSARMLDEDGRSTVRVDGVTLTATPQLIDARAALNAATAHRIEIVVPVTAPEGLLARQIGWEIEEEP